MATQHTHRKWRCCKILSDSTPCQIEVTRRERAFVPIFLNQLASSVRCSTFMPDWTVTFCRAAVRQANQFGVMMHSRYCSSNIFSRCILTSVAYCMYSPIFRYGSRTSRLSLLHGVKIVNICFVILLKTRSTVICNCIIIRCFPFPSPHCSLWFFYCGKHKSNQTPIKRWMEKLVLTSFLSPTNCFIQRHTFRRKARKYRSVDHRGVWKTCYNLSAHKPSILNVVTLCVKLYHHVLFAQFQHIHKYKFLGSKSKLKYNQGLILVLNVSFIYLS